MLHTKLHYLTLANQMGKHQRHCYFRTGVHGGHRERIMQNDPRVRYLYTLEVGQLCKKLFEGYGSKLYTSSNFQPVNLRMLL